MTDDLAIHLIQLSKWNNKSIGSEKERWLYLFKEGRNIDLSNPPCELQTGEMKEAIDIMNRFSKDQTAMLLYQSCLDSLLLQQTFIDDLEMEREAKEREREAKEQALSELNRLKNLLKEKGFSF